MRLPGWPEFLRLNLDRIKNALPLQGPGPDPNAKPPEIQTPFLTNFSPGLFCGQLLVTWTDPGQGPDYELSYVLIDTTDPDKTMIVGIAVPLSDEQFTFSDLIQDHVYDITLFVFRQSDQQWVQFVQHQHIEIQWSVFATAGPNGSVNPPGNNCVPDSRNITFTISPDLGYETEDVFVDGQSVGPVPVYTFEDVDDNHTISAFFVSAVVPATCPGVPPLDTQYHIEPYVDGQLTPCVACNASANPAWTGLFDHQAACLWQAPATKSISGKQLTPGQSTIILNDGVSWTMIIACQNPVTFEVIWTGTKTSGSTPAGPYTRDSGCDATPTLTVAPGP